jgi:hypothetical protein
MERHTMKKASLKVLASVLVFSLGLASGCGGGGGSSRSPSNPVTGGGGGGGNNEAVQGVSTPSSVSVVTAQNADQVQ